MNEKLPTERIFISTDLCMWEKNRIEGGADKHCIIVVDEETGQTFHINGGSRIKFVSGEILGPATQEDYNKMDHETDAPTTKKA